MEYVTAARRAAGAQEWTDHVTGLADHLDAAIDLMNNPHAMQGDLLPWEWTHDKVGFRPNEVSLWAGVYGHGKSLLMNQIFIFMPPQVKILLASMECRTLPSYQ